jgi:hypothetical protein
MTHAVTVTVGPFAREVLGGESGNVVQHVASRAGRAIRTYLADKDSRRAGWELPAFVRTAEPAEKTELSLDLDDELWSDLEAEAGRQGVSVDRLVEHAVLYFAAEIDAGRITQRILEDLAEE